MGCFSEVVRMWYGDEGLVSGRRQRRCKNELEMMKAESTGFIPTERIERAIHVIRGHKVMLDEDIAVLYGVETGALVRQVKRNLDRFPPDFMFQLSKQEWDELRCHFGISKQGGRGGRRYAPYAFTEQGLAMLSSVLRSRRAVQVNIEIMRTFVRLREMLASHEILARRLDELESRYDSQFSSVFEAIRQLMAPPKAKKKRQRIGFGREDEIE